MSATVWPILMKFGTMTNIVPLQRIDRKNFEFLEIQDGGSRHFENNKNRDIYGTVWPTFTKVGTLMYNGSLNRFDRKKFRISQIQDGGRPPFWEPLNRHIFATVWSILMKFGMMTLLTHIGPLQRKYH